MKSFATCALAIAAAGFLAACGGGGGGPVTTGGGPAGGDRTPAAQQVRVGDIYTIQAGSISSGGPGTLNGVQGTFTCTNCFVSSSSVSGSGVFTVTRIGGSLTFTPATSTRPTASTPASRSDVQSIDPEGAQEAAAKAAGNLPNFGSVTQSTNAGSKASVSFDGRNAVVTIVRADGSRLRLDTSRDRDEREFLDTVLPGYTYRGDYLYGRTGNDATYIASVYTNWNNDDPADWLAGGYWMHFEGDAGDLSGAEVGAFMDGPEISISDPPDLPRGRTATYRGVAGGYYAYSRQAAGEVGEFYANASLMADFSARTMSGCIGCDGGIGVEGYTDSGEYFEEVAPARLRLRSTPFGSDGTFKGQDVALEHDLLPVTSSSGSWGGQFSNVPNAEGAPRLAAGTVGGEWTYANGGEGAFVGVWFGVDD